MTFELEQFQSQLIELESGELSPEATAELRALLLRSAEARKAYAEWMSLEAALILESNQGLESVDAGADSPNEHPTSPGVSLSERPSTRARVQNQRAAGTQATNTDSKRAYRFDWRSVLTIACTLLALVMGVRLLQLETTPSASRENQADSTRTANHNPDEQELTSTGVALVTRVVHSDTGDLPHITEGTALRPGPFELRSGIAQLEFFCGATLVVEGPAQLELISEKAVQCFSGKLQANVPPAARGFEVRVADSKVIDLGTEFGIEVSNAGVDLHVYDGEVELQHPADGSPQLLASGASVSWSETHGPTAEATDSQNRHARLVDVESFRRQAEGQSSRSYREWLAFSQELATDPRLIAYYGMQSEDRWQRKLMDTRSPADSELTGAIVGAEFSQGRWPEKTAIEFKHPGDRVRVQIPGQFSSLSFCCWVRIDSLDRWYNSLFLTDNYQRGEPHWQILDSGQLFFSVRVSQTEGGQVHKEVLSPVFWKPSMSGQWLHLATTYDIENATTTHYLNGQPLSSEKIPDKQLVSETRIGLASIGNWSAPTRNSEEFAIRNLNGRMDEIMIFSDALTSAEIDDIYQHGKP